MNYVTDSYILKFNNEIRYDYRVFCFSKIAFIKTPRFQIGLDIIDLNLLLNSKIKGK